MTAQASTFRRSIRDRCLRLAGRWQATSDLRRAGFLACFCAVLFVLVNWRNRGVDVIPLALVPVTVCREGTVNLDAYRGYYESLPPGQRYPFVEANGHLYSMKPFFISFLVLPVYFPPILCGVSTDNVDFWINWGRLAAAAVAAGAVGLVYLTVRRWTSVTAATWLSLLLAFGTSVWTAAGQTVQYHTGTLACTAALCLLLRDFPLRTGRATLAGFLAGAAVGMRPTTVVLLLPLGVYLLLPGRLAGWRARLGALAGVLIIPLVNAWMNSWMFGHWYSTGYSAEEVNRWVPPWEGLPGMLVAPNVGLFVQSPFSLLALVGGWAAWRTPGLRDRGLLCAYSLCFLAYWLLLGHWYDWPGGLVFSSRMLSDGYPLWMPLAAVGWNQVRHRSAAVPLLAAAGAWSVVYQLAGIAIFDSLTPLNPAQPPWQPLHHYVLLHAAHFGVASTLVAITRTIGTFVVCAAGAAYVLAPFFLPRLPSPRAPVTPVTERAASLAR